MAQYKADVIAAYFDGLGDGEWTRLEMNPEAEVNFAVHAHYLHRYIRPNWRVLEVGAGAGRFTIELVRLGARVVVTDISSVQLDLNRTKLDEAGLEAGVEERLCLDIVDMTALDDGTFDAVVCYGGPLSYAMDRRTEGLAECVRVAKPDSPLLFSVISLWGSVHKSLNAVLGAPKAANDHILATGDITDEVLPGHRHRCHAFRGGEFAELLSSAGLEIDAVSAATCLSTGWGDRLSEVRADPAKWAELLAMEIEACAQPGCVEAGPHIIGVGLKSRA